MILQVWTSLPGGKSIHWLPMVGSSGDKIALVDLSFYSLTDSIEVDELLYSFSSDELGDLYIDRESLPVSLLSVE